MKQRLKLASLTVGVLTCLVTPYSMAQDNTQSSSTSLPSDQQQAMLALAAKTEELEKELIALRQQIAQLKQTQQAHQVAASTKAKESSDHVSTSMTNPKAPGMTQKPDESVATTSVSPVLAVEETQKYTDASPEASAPYPEEPLTIHALDRAEDEISPQSRYYPTALTANGKILTYIAGTPVVTSPYLGQRPAFDGSDLVIAMSKINQDLRIMEQRDMIEQEYVKEGYPMPNTPILMLSGTLQPLFTYGNSFQTHSAQGNMTLDTAELDTTAIVNPWVEGLASFIYSNAPPAQGGDVTSNSSVSVDKAFVNIGNLSKTPFYLTAGQVYVPFGQYSSYMVSGPLTAVLGKTQIRAAMVGYAPVEDNGFFGTLYAYNSDTTLNSTGAGGGNLVYQYGNEDTNGNLGVSLTSNIGDATGMQSTGASSGQFGGFGADSSTEEVAQTPGYDIHGVFNTGAYSFIGEFVSAMKPFADSAMSYNGEGAQPMALQAEGAYTFKFFHKPAALALGYGWSGQSLALQIPEQRFSATLNVSWWRDTVESLEYRHDMDYSTSDYASGIGATTNTTGTGRSADTVSALLAIYF